MGVLRTPFPKRETMFFSWEIILCMVLAVVMTGKFFRGNAYTIILGFLGMWSLCYIVLQSLLARL